MNWFSLALVGWVLLIIALAIGAYLLGVPPVWIGVGALGLIGFAVIVSAKNSSRTTSQGPPPR